MKFIKRSNCQAYSFFIVCFLLGSSFTHSVYGEQLSKYKEKMLVVEQQYIVKIADYKPMVEVKKRTRGESSYATPEDSTISQISAMISQDHNWWMQGWTEDSQKLLIKRDAELNRSSKDWEARWEGLKQARFFLTHKMEYFWDGIQYVAIGYLLKSISPSSSDADSKGFESAMVFKHVNGKWMATQDLKEDPIFANAVLLWKTTDSSVRIQKKMN